MDLPTKDRVSLGCYLDVMVPSPLDMNMHRYFLAINIDGSTGRLLGVDSEDPSYTMCSHDRSLQVGGMCRIYATPPLDTTFWGN